VTRAYLAWAAVCVIWGTTYLGIRVALETIPPFLMGGLRWTAAGTLLISILTLRRERLPALQSWPSLAVLGILLIGFGNGGVVWAEQSVPSGLTAVLVSATPFWMVGIERFMPQGEKLTFRHVVGLVIGFGGIVMLVWPELSLGNSPGFLGGVLATQLGCAGWAVGSVYARRRRKDENVLGGVAIQMVAAGLCLWVLALARGEWADLRFNERTSTAFVYLLLMGSIVGFSAYAYALKHLPIATVALYAYINPAIAVILGAVVLREPFNARSGMACAVVLAGTAIVKSTETKADVSAPARRRAGPRPTSPGRGRSRQPAERR
jgi:drug/metabolite transporter (DMT)-like permease